MRLAKFKETGRSSKRLFFRPARWLSLILLLISCLPTQSAKPADTTPPLIDVWYGNHQVFGSLGVPQKWVNILGNVTDPESGVRSVAYSINGGTIVYLRLGPDDRRLERAGDFNIEIDHAALVEGNNRLEIAAINEMGLQSTTTIEVDLQRNTWPLPYEINWARVTNAQDVLQIVDGKWAFDEKGIRPVELGYDRVLAIGDMSWTDYEVTVPVTVHGIHPGSYKARGSPGAGLGVNLHWLGHTDDPAKCDWPAAPHCGWIPTGASNWYSFKKDGKDWLRILASPPESDISITEPRLVFGHTYVFKTRVRNELSGPVYYLKVWEQDAGSEPAEWTIQHATQNSLDGLTNLDRGAFLLVLHRVDATFGNITVNAAGR